MKIKHTAALGLSLLLASSVLASPQDVIDLQANGKVEANSTYKVNLRYLRKDKIYYNVNCELNNFTVNGELPISFYPAQGKAGDIYINGKHIGSGNPHTSVNIAYGASKLTMKHVSRKNAKLIIVNGSTKKGEDLDLISCQAESV